MMTTLSIEDVKAKIRAIKDFPKEGIIFRDITTGIKDGETMRFMIDYLCDQYKEFKIDYIAGMTDDYFLNEYKLYC